MVSTAGSVEMFACEYGNAIAYGSFARRRYPMRG